MCLLLVAVSSPLLKVICKPSSYNSAYALSHDFIINIGEHLQIIKQEVKSQGKLVRSLKKRSLWAKNIEEVHDVY